MICGSSIYSRVGFDSSVEVNEVNLSLYYGGVGQHDRTHHMLFLRSALIYSSRLSFTNLMAHSWQK